MRKHERAKPTRDGANPPGLFGDGLPLDEEGRRRAARAADAASMARLRARGWKP